jgi:hypothetical protein
MKIFGFSAVNHPGGQAVLRHQKGKLSFAMTGDGQIIMEKLINCSMRAANPESSARN